MSLLLVFGLNQPILRKTVLVEHLQVAFCDTFFQIDTVWLVCFLVIRAFG